MDVKELINSLAEFDEMEDESGFNTTKAEKKELKENLKPNEKKAIKKMEELKELVKNSSEYSAEVKETVAKLIDEMKDAVNKSVSKNESKEKIKESLNEKNDYPLEGYEDWTTEDFLNQYGLDDCIRMFLADCSLHKEDNVEYTYEEALEGLMQQMAEEDIPAKEALKNWLYEYFDKYELIELQTMIDNV